LAETTLKTLIERFRSKPEWQSADPAVRAEAVLRLPSSEHDVVLALAREDADPRVRRAAVKKLSEGPVLAGIAASDADPGVRDEAEGRLAHMAIHEHDEAQAKAAVAGIREARNLAAVAKAAPLAGAREAAIRALADPKLLASVVRDSGDIPTRLLALGRIEDGATLLALALKVEQKSVAVAAVCWRGQGVRDSVVMGHHHGRLKDALDEVSGPLSPLLVPLPRFAHLGPCRDLRDGHIPPRIVAG